MPHENISLRHNEATSIGERISQRIRFQGIHYRATQPLAIINGKTVGVGDHLIDIQVAGIDQNSVTLLLNGERKIFKLK
jgi:hypothetical protein